jgi:hypothetical protein
LNLGSTCVWKGQSLFLAYGEARSRILRLTCSSPAGAREDEATSSEGTVGCHEDDEDSGGGGGDDGSGDGGANRALTSVATGGGRDVDEVIPSASPLRELSIFMPNLIFL